MVERARQAQLARFLRNQISLADRPPAGSVQLNNEEAAVCAEALEAVAGAAPSSKERLSHRLLNIAGALSEIASNPPNEMDSKAMARLASQLIALAGQVGLREDIDPTRASSETSGNVDSIREISRVNLQRCLRWHPQGINSWSSSDWAVALAGEVGELCNVVKKLNRERDGLAGNTVDGRDLRVMLEKECADVYLYLDLFCAAAGFDLASAVRVKFNEVSERNGFPERLGSPVKTSEAPSEAEQDG